MYVKIAIENTPYFLLIICNFYEICTVLHSKTINEFILIEFAELLLVLPFLSKF